MENLRNDILDLTLKIKTAYKYIDDNSQDFIYANVLYDSPNVYCSSLAPAFMCDNIIGQIRTIASAGVRFVNALDITETITSEDSRLLLMSSLGFLSSHLPQLIDDYTEIGTYGDEMIPLIGIVLFGVYISIFFYF
jgi:hypothetical protein